MASQYPAQLDNAVTLPPSGDNITNVSSAVVNQLRSVILNIEMALGINPGNGFSDVRSRLDFLSSNTITVAGDLAGSPTGQTVIGLRNFPIANIAPVTNQVLQFNGSSWIPSAIPATFSAAHDLSGSSISQTVIGLLGRPLNSAAPTTGQSYVWDGTQWSPATINNFSASGDISGNNVSQQVIGINGIPLSAGTLSPANGDVIFYQSSSGKWINSPSTNIFSPGGDVSGTGSSQFIKSISGNNAAGGTIAINANNLQFSISQANPTISQVATSATSTPLNIKGQGTTNDNNGGNINILGGLSGGDGYIGGILLSTSSAFQGGTGAGNIELTVGDNNTVVTFTGGHGTNAHYIQSGDAGLFMNDEGITLFSLHSTPILFGSAVAFGDGYTAVRIETQENDVYFPQLANQGDGYISIDNSGKIAWSEVPVGIFTPGGDISGSSSHQTVIGLQGQLLANTVPSSGQLISFNGSQYAPASLGGDISGHINTATVSGIQNIPILGGTPTDGYVLTYKQSSNQWQAEVVNSGTLTFGGDVTGLSSANTVGALQNVPIQAGVTNILPFSGAILQYDGTKYVSTGAPPITINGQNLPGFFPYSTAINDTPMIQAILNKISIEQGTGGKIRLVNCFLATPLDLTPLLYSWSTLEIVGRLTIMMNKAELDLPPAMMIEGTGSYSYSGIYSTGSPNVGSILVVNSENGYGPEINSLTTDGYVDGYFHQMFAFDIFSDLTFLNNPSLIGQRVHITGSTPFDFDGYYTAIAAFDGGNAGSNIVRLVAESPYTGSFSDSTANWSCDGYSGTGTFKTAGGYPHYLLKVYNCKGIIPYLACKHWMTLQNCNNVEFNYKLWRISGAESSTVCYLIAGTQYGRTIAGGASENTVFLPDYGVDGYFNAPTITTYEAYPVIRFGQFNSVHNIALDQTISQPGFAMDGTLGSETGYAYLRGCSANGGGGGALPLVIDAVIWIWIERCFFNSTGPVPATIWLANTDNTQGQADGIIYMKDTGLDTYGIISYSEYSGAGPNSSIQISNTNIDGVLPFPTLDYFSFIISDGTYGIANVSLNDTFIADETVSVYWFETSPFYQTLNNVVGSITEGNIVDVCVNMPTEGQAFAPAMFGPIAASLDFQGQPAVNAYNAGLFPMGFNYSTSGHGYTDNMEFNNNAMFSPVITLPFQLPFPNLDTVASWLPFIAGGTGNFDHTDVNGNLLLGPDGSLGKVWRISSSAGIAFEFSFTVPSPQVGDIFMFFCRLKHASTDSNLDGLSFSALASGGITNLASQGIINSSYTSQFDLSWLETCNVNRITKVSSGSGGFGLLIDIPGATEGIVIDQESLAMLYIPVAINKQVPKSDIIKWYRKVKCQVTNATPGDVAVPKRVGLSFGNAARLGTDGYITTTTSATPIYTAIIPTGNAFNISGTWTAVTPSHIADGYTSGGSFMIVGYNSAGTITSNLQTVGTLVNCGTSISAAASTPISLTSSGSNIIIEVSSQYSLTTDWRVNINQCNVY